MRLAIFIEIWTVIGLIAGFVRLAVRNEPFRLVDLLYTILCGVGGFISWIFLFVMFGDKEIKKIDK